MNNDHVVIMAGGIGSRFWPMSTPTCPKQFIDVLGCGRTLLQLTVDRFENIVDPTHVWVVTSQNYMNIVQEQLPQIPVENILLEPCMRNTAPCTAYAAWKIKHRYPQANLVVAAADHIVMNVPEFRRVIKKSLDFTADNLSVVTLGMCPTRPETGYGYIATGEQSVRDGEFYNVAAFKEKPDLATAKEYLAAKNFFWNSGIFIWNVNTIEKAFRLFQPEMAHLFDAMNPYFYTTEEQTEIDARFPDCKNVSIDYGVMEQIDNLFVFPASFGWSDLGTWGSLYEQLRTEVGANAIVGNQVTMIESEGCVVHVPNNKKVVVQGLKDFIIAEKDNTLLICKLEEEQRIKEFSK